MTDLVIWLKKIIIRTTHKNFRREKNAYWYNENNKIYGPFCSACFESKGDLISLNAISSEIYYCDICGAKINITINSKNI